MSPNYINTDNMSLIELKAFQFDQCRSADRLNMNIQTVQAEIDKREQAAALITPDPSKKSFDGEQNTPEKIADKPSKNVPRNRPARGKESTKRRGAKSAA